MQLRAITADGRPCAQASFLLRHDGLCRFLGKADEEGRLRLSEAPPDYSELVAAAPGLAPEGVRAIPPLAPEVVITLSAFGTIEGSVRRVDGGPFSAGTAVVAIPSGLVQNSAERDPEALLDDPEVLMADCAVDGTFALRNAHPQVRYFLFATAPGCLMPEEPPSARVGDAAVDLELHPAYGQRFEFVDARGLPANLATTFGARGGLHMLTSEADLRIFSGHPLAAWLAGVPRELLEPTPTELVVLGTAAFDVPDAGPLELSLHPQGYHAYKQVLRLPRIERGLTRRELRLQEIGNALTHVAFELDTPALQPVAILDPFATLSFGARTGLETAFALGQRDLGAFRAGPLEPGSYRVRFQVRPYLFERMVDLLVEPSGTTLKLDASQAARLDVDVRTSAGEPYFGELALLIASPGALAAADAPGDAPFGVVRFARGPYRFQPIDPGVRYVCVPRDDGTELDWVRAELGPGEAGRITIQLR